LLYVFADADADAMTYNNLSAKFTATSLKCSYSTD